MESLLLDAAGHRRAPVMMPGHHRGRTPRNKSEQYPADPPTVEEIIEAAIAQLHENRSSPAAGRSREWITARSDPDEVS